MERTLSNDDDDDDDDDDSFKMQVCLSIYVTFQWTQALKCQVIRKLKYKFIIGFKIL